MTVYQLSDFATTPRTIEEPRPLYQAGTFRMIPDVVLDLADPYATQVYAVLRRLARTSPAITATVKQIADASGTSERTIQRTLAKLTEHGLIYVEQRFKGPMQLPSQYSFPDDEKPNTMGVTTGHQGVTDMHRVTDRHQGGASQSPLYRKDTNERVKELTPPKSPKENAALKTAFDLFWAEYPKKVGKAEAWQAWCKLNPAPELVEQIMGGVERYKLAMAGKEAKYIKFPQGWINGRRWEDQIEPATPAATEKWGVPIAVWETADPARQSVIPGVPLAVWTWCDQQGEKAQRYRNQLKQGAGV